MAIAKKKQSPLRAALDNERGRNYGLEKQRKAEKQAAKRKGLPPPLPKGAAKKAKQAARKLEDQDAIIEESDDGAEDNVELESGSVSDDEEDDELEDVGGASLAVQIKKLAAAARKADPERKGARRDAEVDEAEAELDDEDELDDDDEDVDDAEEDEEEEEEDAGGALLQRSNKSKAPLNGTTSAADDEDDESDIPLSDLEELDDGSDASDADIIPHQRLTINNTSALSASLARIALPTSTLPFSTHMSVTSATPTSIPDIHDDLNRELSLYAQSLSAVQSARPLLHAENQPMTRPADYFAEMVKSDEHMGRIRSRLVEGAARAKASQDARRLRDAKKFGKAVQHEKLKERAASKRAMLDNVAALKRKRGADGAPAAAEEGLFDVALDDAAAERARDRGPRAARDGGERSAKRARKDEKFGFGGRKRRGKSNDALSSGDVRGLSARAGPKGKAKGKGKSAAGVRPGKSRRAKGRA